MAEISLVGLGYVTQTSRNAELKISALGEAKEISLDG